MSLRELFERYEIHIDEMWRPASAIMAMIAEVNRDPKRRSEPYSPAEFHPLTQREAARPSGGGEPLTNDMLSVWQKVIRERNKRKAVA
ncbi:hypothetical protein LOC70_05705 [Rhodopirellula sp. JC737]|nr:hypothetical protein [Rhodopirellula sp. JC737]